MTLGELAAVLAEQAARAENEQRGQLAAAWAVAALQRVRRLPGLEQLLRDRVEPPSDEELAEMREAHRKMEEEMGR